MNLLFKQLHLCSIILCETNRNLDYKTSKLYAAGKHSIRSVWTRLIDSRRRNKLTWSYSFSLLLRCSTWQRYDLVINTVRLFDHWHVYIPINIGYPGPVRLHCPSNVLPRWIPNESATSHVRQLLPGWISGKYSLLIWTVCDSGA